MTITAMPRSTTKPYKLKFEERASYLYVRVEGSEPQRSKAADYLKDITSECRRSDCSRLVIDKNVPGRLAVWDIFTVANEFPLMGSKLTKIAVVDEHLQRSERNEFSVMVGRESGLDLHVFTNVAEAESWVIDDTSSH